MTSKTIIEIDVTEEADRYRNLEPDLSTPEEMLRLAQEHGYKPYTMGQLLSIAKHRGETFDEVPDHKPSLFTGYATFYSRYAASLLERVQLSTGKTVTVRSLVFPVTETDSPDDNHTFDADVATDTDPAAVNWATQRAVDRAIRYLLHRVAGYIINRLNIIAANEGDARAVWQELVTKIETYLVELE